MGQKKKSDAYYKFTAPEGLILLQGWARAGLTQAQIAANMGIGDRTLYDWMQINEDIRKAVNSGKEVADYMVENALFKSAIGYDITEEQLTKDGTKVKVTRHVPPNVTAQIFWLKNRKPHDWRDKRVSEVVGNIPIVIKDDITE